jgi:hypothetical protein
MSVRVADRVEDWDERSFDGGYAALHDLADADFSGVVRAAGAELWMTSGAVVGIEHGTIEDFEAASGSAYEAPVPALPLLAVMQAADADVRAQYYTEETPISEVEETLSDGGFTGFLELSENVLSGDYFLVFHGGNSMSVGFVGASEQLISGDEAYETAADEVGIYKVRQVDVEPIEIPEPADGGGAAGAAAEPTPEPDETADAAADTETAEADEAKPAADEPAADEPGADEPAADDAAASESKASEPAGSSEPAEAEASGGSAVAEAEPADPQETTASAADQVAEVDTDDGAAETTTRTERSARSQQSAGGSTADSARRRDESSGGGGPATGGARSTGAAAGQSTQPAQTSSGGQAGDLETRAIPSLDPDMTAVPERDTSRSQPEPRAERAQDQPAGGGTAGGDPAGATGAPAEPQAGEGQAADPEPAAEPAGGAAGDLAELEDELAEKEAEIERLEEELEDAEADREELEAELEEVVAERDELAEDVERLEEELRRLEEELGAATDAERRMTPGEAVEGTNLFVDYDSKGAATLADAHDGSESREEVAENLQLGVHTEFEEANVAVNGQEFDEFLRTTLHYRFAEWLVGTLLFEIRDTGHAEALTDLYDAIPQIRRVEFNGAIDVEYTEDGQEKGGRERFDVIFRHRMGDPLVVANLNDSRDPATGGMMETLVTSGERVGQTADSLSAAFLVTSSFFESEALETVSQATQGGILSRDKRTSFVNLSRKKGYHLCLVAAREGNFHMEVPEL